MFVEKAKGFVCSNIFPRAIFLLFPFFSSCLLLTINKLKIKLFFLFYPSFFARLMLFSDFSGFLGGRVIIILKGLKVSFSLYLGPLEMEKKIS